MLRRRISSTIENALATRFFSMNVSTLWEKYPEIAAQLLVVPEDVRNNVLLFARRKYSFKCEKGPDHMWRTSLYSRFIGKNCPYCSGNKFSAMNSLQVKCPELAALWHPTRNGDTTPAQVRYKSKRKYWFQCPKHADHEWEAKPVDKLKGDRPGECPFCCKRKVSFKDSLEARNPAIAALLHPTKNGKWTPRKLHYESSRGLWFQCPSVEWHIWKSTIAETTTPECEYCTGKRSLRRLLVHFPVDVVYPDIAAEWHPTLNKTDIRSASLKKPYWFQCAEGIDHVWECSLSSRINGSKCQFCLGKKLSITNCLETVAPEIARQWHPTLNGNVTPRDVKAKEGATKYWFQCPRGPDHVWQNTCYMRTYFKRGCPFCAQYRTSVTNIVTETYPHVAAEWHPTLNGSLKPSEVPFGSARKVWFQCSKNEEHIWQTRVYQRTYKGSNCPYCSEKKSKIVEIDFWY